MHVGLGGGTQLGIAAGKALCELYHRPATAREIASIINRGGTSGIGTAAFEGGGFLIDGGHTFGPGKEKVDFRPSSASIGIRAPPVIARHEFPKSWKILLATPDVTRAPMGRRRWTSSRSIALCRLQMCMSYATRYWSGWFHPL